VFADVTKKELAKRLFEDLVAHLRLEGVLDGSHVAIDSTAIRAYERKQPKRKSEQTGNANWGVKLDSFGNKITWFGYKLHLAVDTKSELPLVLEVTPAHVNDGEKAPGLMEQAASRTAPRFFMLDAGYDQLKVYEAARNVKVFFITQNYPKKSSVNFQLYNIRWKNDNRLDREPLQA